jgi:outer membrane protein OmpA-like peptidoglycan-associated protein
LLFSALPALGFPQGDVRLSARNGQDSLTVQCTAIGAPEAAMLATARWTGVDGNAVFFTWQRTDRPTDLHLPLDQLVMAGIGQFLDDRIHFDRTGVRTDVDAARLGAGIDRIIGAAAAHFGQPMPRLTPPTLQQLGRLCRIDWSQANFGVDGGAEQDKYLAIYFYVRSQRQELERQVRNDLLALATVDLLREGAQAEVRNTPVPTVCNTVFDEENYLCALDLQADTLHNTDVALTDALLREIEARTAPEAAAAGPTTPPGRLRKRDRWLKAELDAINDRLDRMDQRKEIWGLRDRMERLEERMDELDARRPKEPSEDLNGNPMAALSALTGRNITLQFAKNAYTLTGEHRALLGEVVRAMALERHGQLLIAGFTDASGSPEVNLAISEARAKSVRRFLLDAGISGDRLLISYAGAERSTGDAERDRRVELQWLP